MAMVQWELGGGERICERSPSHNEACGRGGGGRRRERGENSEAGRANLLGGWLPDTLGLENPAA